MEKWKSKNRIPTFPPPRQPAAQGKNQAVYTNLLTRPVLRLAIQLDLKFPNPTRRCQTHGQSPFLPSFTSTPEVRALSSAGITQPQRSYGPLRLPAWPSPFLVTVRVATSARPEPPPLAADRPPCMPCSLPRWTGTGACWLPCGALPRRVSSLPVQPSPLCRRVGVHIFTFEACSSFTRVTACKVAHPPFVGFIARLRPRQSPGSGARKLSSPTNNYLSGSFPTGDLPRWGALHSSGEMIYTTTGESGLFAILIGC